MPLDQDACAPLLDRYATISAQGAFDHVPREFPEVEELTPLWMILMSHQRALAVENPGDHYYETTTLFGNLAGGRIVQENLFEIWLFLRCYPRTILEIGTRIGVSLVNKLAFHPNAAACLVMSVDLYVEQGSPDLVERNLRQIGIDTAGVCYVRGDSSEVVPELAKAMPDVRYEYILVDGSHKAEDARIDLINAIPLLAPSGIIVLTMPGRPKTAVATTLSPCGTR